MKFISVRDLRGKSAEVWKNLPTEREVVVTSNGRPIAILSAVNESNLEESLSAFRQARAVEAVMGLQRRSVERRTDGITMEEIDTEIKAVREKRQRWDKGECGRIALPCKGLKAFRTVGDPAKFAILRTG